MRRRKSVGCPNPELIDVLKQSILSIFEGSVIFWGPMITKNLRNIPERVFKTGLHLIYQNQYLSYSNALRLANDKSLRARRLKAITNFSKKAINSEKYRNCFSKSTETDTRTRWKPTASLKPLSCRTQEVQEVKSYRDDQAAGLAPPSEIHSIRPGLITLLL